MGGDPDIGSLALTANTRLQRTRHERSCLLSCVGEPLKRSVRRLNIRTVTRLDSLSAAGEGVLSSQDWGVK